MVTKAGGFLVSQLELADRNISKAMKELNTAPDNELYLSFIEFITPDGNMLIILGCTHRMHQKPVYAS